MPLRIGLRSLAHALRLLWLLILCVTFPLWAAADKTRPVPTLDSGYVAALAAANHFLQAWQSGDVANGMALMTSHAKEAATTDVIEKFFSGTGPSAYEIERGKLLKRGRYEFPVVLVSADSRNRPRRRFSSIIVLRSGDNDWAVDKLP